MKIILLAAGLSSRLNTGEQKLIKKYNEKPLIYNSLAACLESFDTTIVLGYKSDEVRGCAEKFIRDNQPTHSCTYVINESYSSGQFSSCITGLEKVNDDFMFVLSDTPNIDSNLIKKVAEQFFLMPQEYNCLRPFVGDKPIHPIAFRKETKQAILTFYKQNKHVDFRQVLQDEFFRIKKIKIEEQKYYKDVDTLKDLDQDIS